MTHIDYEEIGQKGGEIMKKETIKNALSLLGHFLQIVSIFL